MVLIFWFDSCFYLFIDPFEYGIKVIIFKHFQLAEIILLVRLVLIVIILKMGFDDGTEEIIGEGNRDGEIVVRE